MNTDSLLLATKVESNDSDELLENDEKDSSENTNQLKKDTEISPLKV